MTGADTGYARVGGLLLLLAALAVAGCTEQPPPAKSVSTTTGPSSTTTPRPSDLAIGLFPTYPGPSGFGAAIAASDTMVAVGVPQTTANGHHDSGAVYIYALKHQNWTQALGGSADYDKYPLFFTDAAGEAGTALALHRGSLFIGVPGDIAGHPGGSVHRAEWNGSSWVDVETIWPKDPIAGQRFGQAIAAGGSRSLLIGAPGGGSGHVEVFNKTASAWTYIQSFNMSAYLNDGAGFGSSISTFADFDGLAVIGAPYATFGGHPHSGAVYFFASPFPHPWRYVEAYGPPQAVRMTVTSARLCK